MSGQFSFVDMDSTDFRRIITWLKSLKNRWNFPNSPSWSKEDEAMYSAFVCEVINEKMNPTLEQVKWIRNLRDRLKCLYLQPQQEWSKKDEEKLSAVISLMKSSRAVDPFYDKICLEGWLKSLPLNLKKKNENIAKLCSNEWSKEEIGHLYTLASYIKSKGYEDDGEFLEGVANKLKSFHPQSKQEWSEEDEKILDELLDHCNTENATWYNWLKSLRPPQYCENCKLKRSVENWKPSKEQIKALQCAIAFMEIRKASDYNISPLKSLYEQLKKL